VERRQASAPDSGRVGASRSDPWRGRTRWCGGFLEQRLPAFRFLYLPEASLKEEIAVRLGETKIDGFTSPRPAWGRGIGGLWPPFGGTPMRSIGYGASQMRAG